MDLNVSTWIDVTIKELAETIAEAVGFSGELVYDSSKPDGTPRKLLDVSKINKIGWQAGIPLKVGIAKVYQWYLEQTV